MSKVKKIKKKVKHLLYAGIVFVIILALGKLILNRNYKSELNVEEIDDKINISEFRIKTIFDKKIKDRITRKINQNVFVGETDKQIRNGYYDIKAYIQNNKCIVIYLNKLWKEFDERLYEEDYITEITGSIKDILDINIPQNKIYDYILDGYLSAKNSNDNKEYVLDLDKYVIKGEVLEKEFVMSIYKK